MLNQSISSIPNISKQKVLERINRIVLLRIKTLIVKNLKKEDIAEFEEIVCSGNGIRLLTFATSKIPDFSEKVKTEMGEIQKAIFL